MHSADCVFCKIVSKDIPADILFEDEHSLAFLDIKPNNIGHTLVVPKSHARDIYEIDEETLDHTMHTVKKLAGAVKAGVAADGINIIMNNGGAAGQIVFHAHIHIVPRFAQDGFKHWTQKSYKEGEAAEVASKIKKELER